MQGSAAYGCSDVVGSLAQAASDLSERMPASILQSLCGALALSMSLFQSLARAFPDPLRCLQWCAIAVRLLPSERLRARQVHDVDTMERADVDSPETLVDSRFAVIASAGLFSLRPSLFLVAVSSVVVPGCSQSQGMYLLFPELQSQMTWQRSGVAPALVV